MPRKHCRIGIDPGGDCGITYRPDAPPDRRITFWDGHGSAAVGGSCSFADALNPKFRREFARARAEWFIPFLTRLAAGEEVSIAELSAAHQKATGQNLLVDSQPD